MTSLTPLSRDVWIRDHWIVTQNRERAVYFGDLRIRDGRIAELKRKRGPTSSSRAAGAMPRRVVMPGFVQAHTHLCQTLFRNLADDLELLDWLKKRIWVFEAAHTAQTLRTSALLGIHELLSGGTTCVLDMGTVRHTEAIFEAVRDSGIRANVGKCLMDHPETTPRNLRESTRDALSEAQALYRRWNGVENGRIRASYAPRFVISCTEALLGQVARAAREDGAIVHTHASENLKEIELVKRLVDCENIEYLHQMGLTSPKLVLAHCIWLKHNEMEILRSTKTRVVHCPSSNLKLASGLARVPEMRAKGICVALGADGAPCGNNLDAWMEMRLAALIHKPGAGPRAVRAQEALDLATYEGARALSWETEIGSIAVGKSADLVTVDLGQPENSTPMTPEGIVSALVYSCQARHVLETYVQGRCLYRDGKVATIRLPRLLSEVERDRGAILRGASRAGARGRRARDSGY